MTQPLAALALSLLALLPGCSVYREATAVGVPSASDWRAVVTAQDRERLRGWRQTWREALPPAQGADGGLIARDAVLFDPDRALGAALPPPGAYRCRTIKLGASGTATRAFAAGAWGPCTIEPEGQVLGFHVRSGVQRPTGLIFRETDARAIFLGTLVLGDERSPLRYGTSLGRDMAGYVERIGPERWRLVLPRPRFESILDVVEFVPAR